MLRTSLIFEFGHALEDEWPCKGPDVKGRARPGPNIFKATKSTKALKIGFNSSGLFVPFCGFCYIDSMEFQENILGLIGNTPLVKLNRLARNVKAQVYAKMENLNPGYSVKDRIGVAMIEAAE